MEEEDDVLDTTDVDEEELDDDGLPKKPDDEIDTDLGEDLDGTADPEENDELL